MTCKFIIINQLITVTIPALSTYTDTRTHAEEVSRERTEHVLHKSHLLAVSNDVPRLHIPHQWQ